MTFSRNSRLAPRNFFDYTPHRLFKTFYCTCSLHTARQTANALDLAMVRGTHTANLCHGVWANFGPLCLPSTNKLEGCWLSPIIRAACRCRRGASVGCWERENSLCIYVCLCVSMSIHLSSPLSVSFSLALSISFFHRFNSPLSLRAICRIQQPVTVSVPVSCLSVYLSFSTSFTIPSSLCLSDCLLSLGHSFLSPPPFSLSLCLCLSV